MYKIDIHYSTNRNRFGFLRLYDAEGRSLLPYDFPCFGKADSARASKKGNPSRNPVLPWGDAPSGRFKPVHVSRFDPPRSTFGPTAILLEGVSGDAKIAKDNGRTGLAIHAERGNHRLMATYGCTRLLDDDMEFLCELIDDELVEVKIIDHAKWPPYV